MIGDRRYDFFISGKANEALELGFISPSMFERGIQYSIFLEYRNTGLSIRKSCMEASIRCKCSWELVYDAYRFFTV
jgi:hypothetical protein